MGSQQNDHRAAGADRVRQAGGGVVRRVGVTTGLRTALYARVSTRDKGQDVANQLLPLRQAAHDRGWLVQGEYTDEVSGAKRERPGLDAMWGAIEAGDVQAVIVWRFDRYARTTRHLLDDLERLRVKGIAFCSLQENIDTATPMGKAMLAMVGALAELERDLHIERVKAGIARRVATDPNTTWGRPRLTIDITGAQLLLAQGHSLRQVAAMCNVSYSTLRSRIRKASACTHEWAADTSDLWPPDTSAETHRKAICTQCREVQLHALEGAA
tara:strand:+ start:3130 stop:3939 length:810 start_codon:yes stop_codon:yes gene_type:complete